MKKLNLVPKTVEESLIVGLNDIRTEGEHQENSNGGEQGYFKDEVEEKSNGQLKDDLIFVFLKVKEDCSDKIPNFKQKEETKEH